MQNNFFLASMLLPHSDIVHMNTPNPKNDFRDPGSGTIRGALCCASIQGLHSWKDPAFVVFEGESLRDTLLTASTV